ncbi:MAG: hypothetical protein QXT86_07250, partial [Archaeoglobaceae archaeon]
LQPSGTLVISPDRFRITLTQEGAHTLRAVVKDSCAQTAETSVTINIKNNTQTISLVAYTTSWWLIYSALTLSPSPAACPWYAKVARIDGNSFSFFEEFEVYENPCSSPPTAPVPVCGQVICTKSTTTTTCTYSGTCTGSQGTAVFPEYYSAKIFELASRYQ